MTNFKAILLATIVVFSLVACEGDGPENPSGGNNTGNNNSGNTNSGNGGELSFDDWTEFEHEGFTFKLRTWLCETPSAKEAIKCMKEDLEHINDIIPEDILKVMKKNPIWLEKDLNTGAAWYHISRDWLAQNDMMVEKAKCVEISNYENYVAWSKQNQPLMVLHELTHLYHDLGLEGSYDYAPILNAFNKAKSKGMYTSKDPNWKGYRYNTGDAESKWTKPESSYHMQNHHEYFTESTEAYWGENDYYPFNYEQLKEYDPDMFEVLVDIWGPRPDKVETGN